MSLEGHCLFAKGEYEDAYKKYELVLHNKCRGEKPIHLIILRLCIWYISRSDYVISANLLIQSCTIRRTPRLWLYIGIANYRVLY